MSSLLAKIFPSDANRPASNRLKSLKLRTLLTALTALVCGFIGAQWITTPLSKLSVLAYGVVMQQGSLPPVHVPAVIDDLGYWLPQAAFLLVSGLAIVGFSAGVFGRARARVVMIPPLLLGAAMIFFLPSTSQLLHILPSQVERDIMHGRYDAADRALREVNANIAIKQYVQAQIALRANDEQALRANAEPVLKLVDQLVYSARGVDSNALKATAQFNPEIIHALDVRLNGEPQTEVGMQWEKESASKSQIGTWLRITLPLIGGLALIAAAFGLSSLWNQMRRRVNIIQTEIDAIENTDGPELTNISVGTEPAILDRPKAPEKYEPMTAKEMARAEAMSAHLGLSLAPVMPSMRGALPNATTPAPAPKVREILFADHPAVQSYHRRKTSIAIAVVLVAAYPAWKYFRNATTVVDRVANPCKFVGDWTAARDRSVYKVTLKESGDFVAEPISRGGNSNGPIRGRWAVKGDKMAWKYEADGSADPVDINPIKNATDRSFSLTEVNGSTTQYNLIDTSGRGSCPPRD